VASTSNGRPNLDPDAEDGEAMDATNDEDATMMALMGMSSFSTTKVCNAFAPCPLPFSAKPFVRASRLKAIRKAL
jgi:hypothetical protein